MKRLLYTAMAAVVVACAPSGPTLDGSNEIAFVHSLEVVMRSVPEGEQEEFLRALQLIAPEGEKRGAFLSSPGGPQVQAMRKLHGMSAADVMREASKLDGQHKEIE